MPIALLVDDACPLLHVFREHALHVHRRPPVTGDGHLLAETVPGAFLDRFCDVVAARGMAGNLSTVASPYRGAVVWSSYAGLSPARRRPGRTARP